MLDFDRFRVLTFDCYGTLINWEAGILAAVRPMLSNRSIYVSDNDVLEAYGELEVKLESGEWKRYRQVLRECVAGLGLRFNFSPTASEMDALPGSLPFWPPFGDTVSALRRLRSRFQLAVISNTDDDLFASSARHLEIEFDHVITAEQVKSYKPSHNNFLRAIEKMEIPREQILHVAQSIYHDIVPTRALGISSVWVNRRKGLIGSGATLPAEGRPDLEVPDLKSLADLLLESATVH
jgi:2-haloacid dehalogenase